MIFKLLHCGPNQPVTNKYSHLWGAYDLPPLHCTVLIPLLFPSAWQKGEQRESLETADIKDQKLNKCLLYLPSASGLSPVWCSAVTGLISNGIKSPFFCSFKVVNICKWVRAWVEGILGFSLWCPWGFIECTAVDSGPWILPCPPLCLQPAACP